MGGRLLFVCGALLVLTEVAQAEGIYQPTKNGKTLVWNSHPKPGDVATWSGRRDRDGYAHGFGYLIWYAEEPGFDKPQLYARYWGNMSRGKFDGPVNVHSKKRTHYAIFADGTRVTRWAPGPAPSLAGAKWRSAVARENVSQPEPPAQGPVLAQEEAPSGLPSETGEPSSTWNESIQDLWSERWPKIDIDESLRLLVWPPRTLR